MPPGRSELRTRVRVRGGIGGRSVRAQSLVELALVLPIFVLLLVATVDLARMMAIHSAAVSASREGARYGASAGTSGGTARYVDCAGIRNAARRATDALTSVPDNAIRITHDNGAGTPRTQPCPPHGSGPVAGDIQNMDRVQVEVTVQYQAITPLLGDLIGPITVVSTDRRTIVKEMP